MGMQMSDRECSRESIFARLRGVTSKASDADINEAIDLGNICEPDVFGRFPWQRSERRGKAVGLSKAGLGNFVYAVLLSGGTITSFFVLTPTQNAGVYSMVRLTVAQKRKIEETTEYRFDPPTRVCVN